MLKRISIPLVAALLLSGCVEQEGEVKEAIEGVQMALTNAIEQIQQAVSGEAGELAEQAKEAIDEVRTTADPNELIEMAGDQAVKAIEEAQAAAIEAIKESKDAAREAVEQ